MEENRVDLKNSNPSASLINLIMTIGLVIYFLIDILILLAVMGLDLGGDMGLVILSMFLTLTSPVMIILALVNKTNRRKLFLLLIFLAILPIIIIFFLYMFS